LTKDEAIDEIEKELNFINNEKLLEITENIIPEESVGIIDNDDMKQDIIQILLETIESDNEEVEDTYFYLLDEKISIEEKKESLYETEEFE